MSITVFKKWTSAVLYLDEKIKNRRLIAGRNIRLENTGNGIRIHGYADSSSPQNEDTYTGMFKAIKVSDGTIRIADGFADDPATYAYAGDALICDVEYTNITAAEFTITADSWIYLISTGSTPTLQKFTSRQSYELGKSKTLISRIKFADGKISQFSQEVHGPITSNIDGDCDA